MREGEVTRAGGEAFGGGKKIAKNAIHRVHGWLGDEERSLPKSEHLREAVAMVGVLVGDEDAVDVGDGLLDGREPGESFALAEAAVDEEAGARRFEQRDIARAAG